MTAKKFYKEFIIRINKLKCFFEQRELVVSRKNKKILLIFFYLETITINISDKKAYRLSFDGLKKNYEEFKKQLHKINLTPEDVLYALDKKIIENI